MRAGGEDGAGDEAAFASDLQHLVVFDRMEVADVRRAHLGDAEAVEEQEADERMVTSGSSQNSEIKVR